MTKKQVGFPGDGDEVELDAVVWPHGVDCQLLFDVERDAPLDLRPFAARPERRDSPQQSQGQAKWVGKLPPEEG